MRILYASDTVDNQGCRGGEKAESMFFGQIFGKTAKRNVARCRSMCRIVHPKTRRDVLARMFVRRLVRRRNESKVTNEGEDRHQVLTEAEKDILHPKMNRYLYEAPYETTTGANIKEYQTAKWREAAEGAENGKKRPIPHSCMSLPPHLCLNGRR